MKRKASAVWRGDVKTGKGLLSTESTVLEDAQYSFSTRFEMASVQTRELLAAAHAHALRWRSPRQLGKRGFETRKLAATATITFEKGGRAFRDLEKRSRPGSSVPDANNRYSRLRQSS